MNIYQSFLASVIHLLCVLVYLANIERKLLPLLQAERLKKTFEDEVLSLRNKLSEMEKNYVLKSEEASSLIEAKEKELLSVLAETSALRDEVAQKV